MTPLGITFPFMGRVEHEIFVSTSKCTRKPLVACDLSMLSDRLLVLTDGYISFSGEQTGDSGQASNPETTVIPSAGAKPDDTVFAYWTDMDFSKGGEVYYTFDDGTMDDEGVGSLTVTWMDAPYYCHGAGDAPSGSEWSSDADYGAAWHTSSSCIGKTASFQVSAAVCLSSMTSPSARLLLACLRLTYHNHWVRYRLRSSLTVGSSSSTRPSTLMPRLPGHRSLSA